MRKGKRRPVSYVYTERMNIPTDRWERYAEWGREVEQPDENLFTMPEAPAWWGWRTVGRAYARGRKRATAWRVPSARMQVQKHRVWYAQGIVDWLSRVFRGADMS